ncbi:MAG TPA: type II toxin-antitoxin system prevent-host-death family antitoxin [Candidatus Acidoferrales bacterium]|nr:type II toxin-antitoxin system prevent-host-death family antitoxin [Candidatus Acidoferrales bacterium]
MDEFGASEVKNKLAALLDLVEQGKEITITRWGKPVAKLVPAGPGFDRDKARAAAAQLLEASRGVKLGRLKLKDLIAAGRP